MGKFSLQSYDTIIEYLLMFGDLGTRPNEGTEV